ncbi:MULTISPECIES: exonuclease subunit SbcD [Brenneria]|uniref:Nuclease SbcCD subunit D n=1 Tax=Brenneria nigrifluens DSM 30175 = ATCC 13028 TaxID=1121120 RepID=A0A2U1UWD0_9GAMM|nr:MULTISPECIES: exonuclease subunit SbcD [Brenneria]EHD22770.1 nuclease SbcCD, D subunit [Brenneria sp. EniD312]PWC25871.1 exonuclease subunit SbcD [Brenneria nigrifluens] [Brenneria nigrifluens DSM 30175 = ATCC 13028]QCR05745.1 exonuclease subunit SbcD [Brenneria nigrifluens] [Brenneria nigrifluens DSM 30175 = ATCC 13028]
MRIIHTADWHLGQYFYTKSRAAEHQAFLHWLLEQVEQQQADAVIVAGDIFDNGSPPSYAREMYYRFVVDMQRTGCRLVVLGGNHDSVATLNESRDLLACLNTRVIASVDGDVDKQVLVLENRRNQPAALLCAIPFLRPRDLIASQAGQSGDEKQQALLDAITTHYRQCYQSACRQRDILGLPLPIIATGHLTTVGVTASDSVRDIYIGTLDAFPAQAFPPADYIALGHIHRPQRVTKSAPIYYSGSPIPLSFDELSSRKSVYLVDLAPGGPPTVEALPVPVTQPMRLIKGDLAEIERQLAAFSDYQGEKPVWLDIEITTQDYLSDMQKRIQALTDGLPVEVLLLRRAREQHLQAIVRQQKETLNELTVHEVFERRLASAADLEESRQQRVRTLFDQVMDELENSEHGA